MAMRKIELSEHFTKRKMLRYSLPSIFESLATNSFQMVDGYFVSNLLGLAPYVAVGLISPAFFMLYALGFMFGEGASALISQIMGEGDRHRARVVFSMTTAVMLLVGAVLGGLAVLLMPKIARLVGATDENIGYCVEYGHLLVIFLPAYLVNSAFMSLYITAEKGWYGMVVSAINGLSNVALDWLFMGPMNMGVRGAALATSLAALLAATITIVYFSLPNRSSLRFARFTLRDVREIVQICANGASEMVSGITGNVVELLTNLQLLRFIGEVGVAAFSVFQYVFGFFLAITMGISTTAITVVGYKFGEKKRNELDHLLKDNLVLSLLLGTGLCLLAVVCAGPIARLYVGYDAAAYALTERALRIMSLSSVFFGFFLVVSAFFTGLGNGLVSAIIALCGSFAAPALMIFVVPALFGEEAIWYALPLAMLLTAVVCVICLNKAYWQKKDLW